MDINKYILIESHDGAGKSSLADFISKTFYLDIYKESLSYQDRLREDYDGYIHYKKLIKTLPKNVVIDRLHIGEAVNPIIRKDGRKPLTIDQIHDIENPIKNQTLLITCLVDEDVVVNTFKTRGEDVAKIEDIRYLAYLYRHFHNLSSIKNKIIFNYLEDNDYIKIKKQIEDFLKKPLQTMILV